MAQCLTIRSTGGLLNVLISEVGVSVPYTGTDPQPQIAGFKGIWDTGATGSAITQNVVKALGLKATGVTEVNHAQGKSVANVYLVNIYLPSNIIIPSVRVTESVLAGVDLLIGMDVIGAGDFSITNFNGNTVMSFRFPSSHEIDYVKQAQAKTKGPQLSRNQKKALRRR